MFSEIINTVFFSFFLFLILDTHKCSKQVEEKIEFLINELNSVSYSESDSGSDSDLESDSDSDSKYSSFPNYVEFKPFIEKSSNLLEFKDYKIKERSMSF